MNSVDFTNANLTNTKLTFSNLSGANCKCANMRGSYLFGVDFTNANLIGTDLSDTNLQGANLVNADIDITMVDKLHDVRYEYNSSTFTNTNFTKAKYDSTTKFPDWFNPEKAGMIKLDKYSHRLTKS